MAVHPLNYELARAKAIRKIYETLIQEAGEQSFWTGKAKGPDLEKYGKYWVEWNKPLVKHSIGEYENENAVLFKDKFVDFIKRLRAG